jgi:hypothetical protein
MKQLSQGFIIQECSGNLDTNFSSRIFFLTQAQLFYIHIGISGAPMHVILAVYLPI